MSFLVELPRSTYPDDAMNAFSAAPGFCLDHACAMMWMAQLGYETANEATVDDILRAWGLSKRAFVNNPPGTWLPLRTSCAVVAGGRGATILSFAGTDPLKINDWITDFRALPAQGGVHDGFLAAVDAIWPRISAAIGSRPQTERKLFFTGHSLGGVLAIVAAERALRELNETATAVYTFGSPRPGGTDFFNTYRPPLGDSTFRLVHGTDIVPTVPPPLLSLYRHVGQMIQCRTEGIFDAQPPILAHGNNKPDFAESAFDSAIADFSALFSAGLFRPVGRRLLGQLAAALPRMVRDHIPESYFRALSITLN